MSTTTLYPLISNRRGGYNVKTIISPDIHHVFKVPSKGLYAWCYESQLAEIERNGVGKIKPGQYGTYAAGGTLPQDTINSYNWSAGEAVVILGVYPFSDEDLQAATPYQIEQQLLQQLEQPVLDGKSQETFITSIDEIENKLKKLLNKNELTHPYIPSSDNERAITMMLDNPHKYFGLFAAMRHGKSYDYLEYIDRKYTSNNLYYNHAVFCHDTKTYNGWKTKIERTYRGRIRCVELKNNKDYDFSSIPDMNTVVLVSPQLISAAVDNKDIPDYNAKIEFLKNAYSIKAENVLVDEAHNYFTPQWETYYESILQDGQIILASGTYANLLQKHQDKFDESNTFIWGIDKLKQKLLKEQNINLILKVKIINPEDFTEEGLFNIANLQSVDDGVLSNQYHFEQFINKLLDKNSKFSPIFSHGKHHLILLDTVKAAQELKKILKSKKYSDKIMPILVAGSKDRDANSEEELNKLISDADARGLRTITITCGSMIQGVSERRWKNVLNMSSKSTYEIYWQLFGRTFEIDSVLDKHVGPTPKDMVATMWDYNLHRIYSVGADFVDATAKVNGGNQEEALKTFHEIVDIIEWIPERRTWSKPKTLEELESKVYEIVNKHTIKRGLTINTCLNKSFTMNDLNSTWVEWAIHQEYKNNKNAKKIKEKLDIWQQSFGKQTTDHSISVQRTHVDLNQKQLIDLQEQVKKVFENSLDKLGIVWAVYKSQGKVNSHIDELFKYYTDEIFLTGMGFPNAEISKIFVDTIAAHGLIDKINGKLKNSRIETIENLLNLNKEDFLVAADALDALYTYSGDDTQLSVRAAYDVLDEEIKEIKCFSDKIFHVPYTKSGSINVALAYILKEKSKKIFGKKLNNQEIIKMVTFEDENLFFASLNSAMGFTKSTSDKKDFIVINPPYSSGLHLDIFLKSFKDELNDYGILICIHRETPVITKTPSPNKNTKEYRDIMLNNTSEITFFDGNKVFPTALFFAPLIISRVVKDSNKSHVKINLNHLQHPHSYEINDFNDVFIHTDIEKTIRIRKKLLDKMSSENLSTFNEMSTKKIKNSPYYVNIKQIGGHGMVNGKINKDFYCLVSPKFEYDLNNQITSDLNDCLTPAGRGGGIRANSYDEAVNIFEFMKTKVARFFISFTKIDQNIWDGDMLSILPYLDFTKKWDDESLFKYFELEDDLIEYINEYIEPIYEYEKSN
jgi:hypothetical protein